MFYAFDPRRTAILLIAGHKTRESRFYGHCVPRADMIYDRYLNELRRKGLIRSYQPYTMTHRPWSELTKHWSPERRAANKRAEAKIDTHIPSLQSRAVNDDPAAGTPSRRPSSLSQSPRRSVESGLEPARDFERDHGPSR